MEDYLPNNDVDEFRVILTCLDDIELAILHQALFEKNNEGEQKRYIREQIQIHVNNKPHDGKIHNAYFARVLVSNPVDYIKEEIVIRFIKKSIG